MLGCAVSHFRVTVFLFTVFLPIQRHQCEVKIHISSLRIVFKIVFANIECCSHARPSRSFGDDAGMDLDEIVWDAEGDMKIFISSIASNKPGGAIQPNWQRGTTALAWVMADTLTKIRWGIIHAGVTVLRGLVPQRLINQYEDQT